MHILLLGKMIFTKEIFTAFHQLINIDSRTHNSGVFFPNIVFSALHFAPSSCYPRGTPECAGEVWGGTKSGEVG